MRIPRHRIQRTMAQQVKRVLVVLVLVLIVYIVGSLLLLNRERAASALREGVRVRGLSEYYMERRERCPENCVILGYAGLRDKDILELAGALKRAWVK